MSCTCQVCGKKYKMDLWIPDCIWEEIKPDGKSEGQGLLCPMCIMERIEKRVGYDAFCLLKLTKEEWNLCESGAIEWFKDGHGKINWKS
jgi:hypothetical protein